MTPEEEKEFIAVRHRYYKTGKAGPEILQSMGMIEIDQSMIPSKEEQRDMLFKIADQGRLPNLLTLIEQREAEILE